MELTGLKNILNTGEVNEENLPGYSIGKIFKKGGFLGEGGGLDKFLGDKNDTFGTNGAAIGTAATGVLDMVNGIGAASKFNRTADDLLRDAGTSLNNIGGVGYTVQNGLDDKQIESETNAESTSSTLGLTAKGAATGAAIASVIPGVGTAVGGIVGGVAGLVGGLFGGGAKKREMKRQMRLAEIKRINTNSFNQSGALTTVLQNNLALTEGNQEDQALYGAADGKLPGFVNGFTPNCKLSNGEHVILHDPIGNPIADIPVGNGRDNKDTVKAFIPNNASVITNKYGASEYLEKTGDINGAEYLTAMNILDKKYKNGKLPGFVNGLEAINAIGNLGLAGLSMLDSYRANNEEVYNPHSYLRNEWEAPALSALRNLRVNTYPIMGQIYDNTAKGVYAINNAGGTSGGQRAVSRLQQYEDAARTIANMQTAAQDQNNKYTQRWAEVTSQLGALNAELGVKTRWHDDEVYAQGHGRRDLKADKRRADALTFLQSYLKGVNDIHMYRQMKDMWDKEFEANHPEADANKSINSPKVQLDPMSLVGKTNFAGAKSYAMNPLAGSVEAGRPLPEFTAITPKRKKELEEWAKLPKRKVALPWEYNSRADYTTTYPPFFGGFADYSYGSLDNIKLRR